MRVAFIDSTLRDGQETLLGGRLRLDLVAPILETLDEIGFQSIEAWGGGTFQAAISRLREDPWERLRLLLKQLKRTPVQILLRGRFLVGDRPFSYEFVKNFLKRSAELGVQVVRLFDPVNNFQSLSRVAQIAKRLDLTTQGSLLCSDWNYELEHYRSILQSADLSQFDSLGIFDPLGTLSTVRAGELTTLLRDEARTDVFVHVHNLEGSAISAVMRAQDHGASIVDTCFSAFASEASLPSVEGLLRNLEGSDLIGDLSFKPLLETSRFLRRLRQEYFVKVSSLSQPATTFEETLQEIKPSSSLLLVQRMGERKLFHEAGIGTEIATMLHELGLVALATPLSEVLARQAQLNLQSGRRYEHVTDEFLRLLRGEFGPTKVPRELSQFVRDGLRMPSKEREELTERQVLPFSQSTMNEECLMNFTLFPQEWEEAMEVNATSLGGQMKTLAAGFLAALMEEELQKEPSLGPEELRPVVRSVRWSNTARFGEAGSPRAQGFIQEPF